MQKQIYEDKKVFVNEFELMWNTKGEFAAKIWTCAPYSKVYFYIFFNLTSKKK